MKTKFLKLGGLLLLLGCLFFPWRPAKADGGIYLDGTGYSYRQNSDDGQGNFTFANTISSSCGNSFLMAFIATWTDGYGWDNVSYDGISMTDSGLGSHAYVGGARHMRWQTFVLAGPHSGTHNFHFHNTRGQYSDPATIVLKTFCNVDQASPLDFVRGGLDSYSGNGLGSGYFNISHDNSLVLFNYILATGGTVTGTSGYSKDTLNADNDSGEQIYNFFTATVNHKTATDYYSVGGTDTDWARSLDVFVLNYAPATYCGDGICQTATENCSTCPSDCGVCADNPNAGDISLFFFSNPYTLDNQTTARINYLYNQSVFTSYDYIEVRQDSPDWTTSTFVATSTIIDSSGFFTDKSNGHSFFTLTGNASTTGLVNYEVIGHLAAYWSPTLGDVAATTTIPYVVAVNWQNTQVPTAADILAASSTNPFYDDNAMYNAACTAAQWATPDPQMWLSGTPLPALNFTVIGCQFKLGMIIAGNKFTTIITDGLNTSGNILKNVFPFNVFTNLNDAWKASATATVLPELAFLTPVGGDLTAQIPTTGTSTATVILWGKDIFTSSSTLGAANAAAANQLFLAIKTIIKWALWGLFGIWAVKNGKAFVEELTDGE